VRVNVQLIDAQSGAYIWADRFEEDVADLFKLQDEVVNRLANSLGNELVKAEARGDSRIANLDAFDLTMRGRALSFEVAMFANYVEKCQRFTLKFGGSDGRRGF